MQTKSLREIAQDELEQKSKQEGLHSLAKKAKKKAKKAGSGISKGIKWLTSESGSEHIQEGIGDIRAKTFMYGDDLNVPYVQEFASMIGIKPTDMICVDSTLNPNDRIKYKKWLLSPHWLESRRSTLLPELACSGYLVDLASGYKIPAVSVYCGDKSTLSVISYYIDVADFDAFRKISEETFYN